MATVVLRCSLCDVEFERAVKTHNQNIKRKVKEVYCSKDCQNRSQVQTEPTPCFYCGKTVGITPSRLAKSESGLTFCSHSCKSKHFNTLYVEEAAHGWKTGLGSYRDICFRHHDRSCVVCFERLVVDVHHLNGNREDNDPSNLIPLCPTHHRYWHSSYRYLIESAVNQYREGFIESTLGCFVPLIDDVLEW